MQKIIVIDDDSNLLKTISLFLTCEGYSVIECNSAVKGYLEFKGQSPNLVITDLNMPLTSGIDYIYKVRELDRITPIIAMSANSELLQTLMDKKSELNLSVILKPFQLPDLKRLVEEILATPAGTQVSLVGWEGRLSAANGRYLYAKDGQDQDGMIAALFVMLRIILTIQLTKQGFGMELLFANEGFSLSLPIGKTEESLGIFPLWQHYQQVKIEFIRLLTQSESLGNLTSDLDGIYQHASTYIR